MTLGKVLASLTMVAVATRPGMAQGIGPVGTWGGDYTCAQGITGLRLQVEDAGSDRLRALFEFRAIPANPKVPPGCFVMSGSHDPATGHVSLTAGRWITRPPSFVTVDLDGMVRGDSFQGTVIGPLCDTFRLHRTKQDAPPLPAPCAIQGLVASSSN